MKVVIRADASIDIGTGHVMRCLTLAHELKERGASVSFISREHPGNLCEQIQKQGFSVHVLPYLGQIESDNVENSLAHGYWLGCSQTEDANASLPIISGLQPDWIIVDHYGLDSIWQKKVRDFCKAILVIDDLADRIHDCDLLLDQNAGSTREQYANLVPKLCKLLVGPSFTLLRPEFKSWRRKGLNRRKSISKVSKILINMGGVDKDNVTGQILSKLKNSGLKSLQEIIVVMGPHAPHIANVTELATQTAAECHVMVNVANMGELMTNVDLAIGASGATTWERCCLGLPTIQLVIAQNQKKIAQTLAAKRIVKLADNPDQAIVHLFTANTWFQEYSKNAMLLTDGQGAGRVVDEMFGVRV